MASEPPMPVMMIARFDSYEGLQEQATATGGFLFSLQALAAEINQSTKIALSFYLFFLLINNPPLEKRTDPLCACVRVCVFVCMCVCTHVSVCLCVCF